MASYQDALRGASEFLSGASHIDRNIWRAYVQRMHVIDRYPGATAMAIIEPVDSDHLESFAAEQRRLYHTDFKIHTALSGEDLPVVPSMNVMLTVSGLPGHPRSQRVGKGWTANPSRMPDIAISFRRRSRRGGAFRWKVGSSSGRYRPFDQLPTDSSEEAKSKVSLVSNQLFENACGRQKTGVDIKRNAD